MTMWVSAAWCWQSVIWLLSNVCGGHYCWLCDCGHWMMTHHDSWLMWPHDDSWVGRERGQQQSKMMASTFMCRSLHAKIRPFGIPVVWIHKNQLVIRLNCSNSEKKDEWWCLMPDAHSDLTIPYTTHIPSILTTRKSDAFIHGSWTRGQPCYATWQSFVTACSAFRLS